MRTHKEVAMATSRDAGAVGNEHALVPIVQTFALPHHTILNFGAGKHAVHSAVLRTAGHNVTSYDYHGEKPDIKALGLHDMDALKRRYDIVFASNVLNVQNTGKHLARTLNEIAGSVNPATGMAIVNLPQSPRKDAFKGMDTQQGIDRVERALKRRFGHVERHPAGSSHSPIWIAKQPKHPAPAEQRELENA
jgi:hypothetical protein